MGKSLTTKNMSGIRNFINAISDDTGTWNNNPEALIYKHNFNETKDDLVQKLFELFNCTVFENMLPSDMKVTWNTRFITTAGTTIYSKVRNSAGLRERRAVIQLSSRLCDTAERVRDTLIHEMCHAAVFLIDRVDCHHGPYWKAWCSKVALLYPDLPFITIDHTYEVSYKYVYVCKGCWESVGRLGKAIDVQRTHCRYCGGQLLLEEGRKKI